MLAVLDATTISGFFFSNLPHRDTFVSYSVDPSRGEVDITHFLVCRLKLESKNLNEKYKNGSVIIGDTGIARWQAYDRNNQRFVDTRDVGDLTTVDEDVLSNRVLGCVFFGL